MNILEIIVIFIVFCIVWVLTQIAWRIIEGKMMIKLQNQRMDAAYAKLWRLAHKSIRDFKDVKEIFNREM